MPVSTGPVEGAPVGSGPSPPVQTREGKKKPPLHRRTGESYPHNGYLAVGRDIRLTEYLANLTVVRHGEDHEALLWVLCAGVWWLRRDQADRLAAELARILGP
jgi:hypothetical protein